MDPRRWPRGAGMAHPAKDPQPGAVGGQDIPVEGSVPSTSTSSSTTPEEVRQDAEMTVEPSAAPAVPIGEQAAASLDEEAAVPGVAFVTEDIETFISGLDSGEYASAGPPQAKLRAKRAQGRGPGIVGSAPEVVEEEALAPSDGSSSAGSAAEE